MYKVNFPVLKDPSGTALKIFYLDGMPAVLLVDADGRLILSEMGYGSDSMRSLEDTIKVALSKRAAENRQ